MKSALITALTVTGLSLSLPAQESAPAPPEGQAASKEAAPKAQVVEAAPLEVSVSFEATVLPAQAEGLIFAPKAWNSFSVIHALPHGTRVKAGDQVVQVDTRDLEKATLDQKNQVASLQLELQEAETNFARFERDQKLTREQSERTLKRAQDDYQHFLKVTVPIKKRNNAKSREASQRHLDYQKEELKQLQAMYAEDQLTEETEEIILIRAKNAVRDAEFAHEKALLEADKELETILPRQIEDYELSLAAVQRQHEDLLQNQKFARAKQIQALDAKKLNLKRAEDTLEQFQHDLELAAFTAPIEGSVFYGVVEDDGHWNFSDAPKRLVRGGNLAKNQPLYSIVPEGAPLFLSANVDAGTRAKLELAQDGYASLGDSKIHRCEITSIECEPQALINGTHRVHLQIKPTGFLAPAQKLKVQLHGRSDDEPVLVPKKAVSIDPDGSTRVTLLADDSETEERVISLGREGDEYFEVLSGLEAGDTLQTK